MRAGPNADSATGGMDHPRIAASGSEPTVFGAVRRYRTMVLAIVVGAVAVAVAYTVVQGPTYRASASLTVALPASQQTQNSAQYLDSEVLLLQSQAVASRAAVIANGALGGNHLSTGDFYGTGRSLTIIPPEAAAQGVYGASIINLTFAAPSAKVAQTGANAVISAYEDVRSAEIRAQADATIAGINSAIADSSPSQRTNFEDERTQTIANEQTDLANQPTVAWAIEPTSPVSLGWKRATIIGLVAGIVIGFSAAYARASLRRRRFTHRWDAAALYDVPLIGEIPASEAEKTPRSNGIPAGDLLPMIAAPQSAVAEAFRFVAGSVERVRAEHGPRLSLVLVSPLASDDKSMVIANLALAIAEGGTRVLAVDAAAGEGNLTARLLPGIPTDGGLEQVLAGERPLASCVQPSPLSSALGVLPSAPAPQRRVTGAARLKAASALIATGKQNFDVVLIDSPALLQVADATELVNASDAAIIVLSPDDLIQNHLEMLDRLKLIGSDVVGYIYNRAPMPAHLTRHRRNGSSTLPMGPQVVPGLNGKSRPSSRPQPLR